MVHIINTPAKRVTNPLTIHEQFDRLAVGELFKIRYPNGSIGNIVWEKLSGHRMKRPYGNTWPETANCSPGESIVRITKIEYTYEEIV